VDESSVTDAEALKGARWAEGCRGYEAIRRLIEDHKPRPPKFAVADTAWELGVSRATLYRLVDIYKSAGTLEALRPKAMGRRAGTWVEEIIERAIRFASRGQRRGEEDVVKATNAAPGKYSVSRPLEVVQIDHTEIGQSQIDS